MLKSNNLILALVTLLCLQVSFECHKKSHKHETIDHEKFKFLTTDFRNIFRAYGESSTTMNVTQLNSFLDDFQSTMSENGTERENCISHRVEGFSDLVSKWNNETKIDRNTFAKISSYLVSYVIKCSKDQNEIETYPIEIKRVKLNDWQKFIKNIPLISKESKHF